MKLVFLLAPFLALGLAPAGAQEAPEPIRLTPKDAENFIASAPGALRIVGDDYRYDIVLPADVLFDFDKSELRPDAAPLLAKVKAHLSANRTDQVHVRGHTDSKGTSQYNFVLSQKRAGAVCDWLKAVMDAYVMCIGRGEEEPLLPNENADGSDNAVNRQLNRRVTLSVVRYPDAREMLDDAEGKAGTGEALDEAKAQAEEALKGLKAQ